LACTLYGFIGYRKIRDRAGKTYLRGFYETAVEFKGIFLFFYS